MPEPLQINEKQVQRATVRWLLPDVEKVGAHLRRQAIGRAAADLGVTSAVVWDRLDWATEREHNILDGMLGDRRHLLINVRAAGPILASTC